MERSDLQFNLNHEGAKNTKEYNAVMTPIPPPLGREEFRRRAEKLRREGKPVRTLIVDTELAEWVRRNHIPAWAWAVLYVAGAIIIAMALILLFKSAPSPAP